MPEVQPAAQVLEREFLEVRAKILEIAASLDRLDRGAGGVDDDSRMDRIRRGLGVLDDGRPNRAERVQMIFSLPYEPNWRENWKL